MNALLLPLMTLEVLVASPVLAIPVVPGSKFATSTGGVMNTGVEGSLTMSLPREKTGGGIGYTIDDMAPGPELATFTVVNKHSAAISTSHAHGAGGPTAVSGFAGVGTIAPNASASFVVPKDWSGHVAVIDAAYAVSEDMSLIEANYVENSYFNVAVLDVDVSYVDGFTLPIICACDRIGIVTGCIKNLFTLGDCAMDEQNACVNPRRADEVNNSASPFFKPCQGAAYTFPNDHAANSFGQCQSGRISCCVGTACGPGEWAPF